MAQLADDKKDAPRQGLLKSLLHGSESAREDGMTSQSQSHSNTVGRGKYIHEIQSEYSSTRPRDRDDALCARSLSLSISSTFAYASN